MINTFHTSLPPPPVPPRMGTYQPATGRISTYVWFFSVVFALQMVLTLGGFVYLLTKSSTMQNQFLDKRLDDLIVLKRLQECDDGSLGSSSLLDCRKILDKYRAVMSKLSQTGAPEKGALLTGWVPFRDSTVVAHMIPDRSSTSKILKWDSQNSLTAKVTYLSKDGALKILESGNYYIYSQVTFTMMHPKVPLAQSIVCQWGPEKKEKTVLLRAYATLKSENQQFTSFQGGVFWLEKDKELYLNVTNTSFITFDGTSTTFGLFML
ncbi:hypothetical protein GJAV_G00257390 [Gymnothorax javanicus]|nr:hypothetical protein GJAV_G00257390 [Gymnothorax javanicus]